MQSEPVSYLQSQPSASMSMLGVEWSISTWLCDMTDSSPFVAPGLIVYDL